MVSATVDEPGAGSTGLTEEDVERLKEASEVECIQKLDLESPDDSAERPLTGEGKAYSVTKRLCRAIRDYLDDHGYEATAEHFGLNVMTVKRHSESYTKRSCTHESEGIDSQRCAVMREMARDGWSQRELADYFDVARATSRYHIIGECTCNNEVEPVEYGKNTEVKA